MRRVRSPKGSADAGAVLTVLLLYALAMLALLALGACFGDGYLALATHPLLQT